MSERERYDHRMPRPNNGARTLSSLRVTHGLTLKGMSDAVLARTKTRVPVSMLCKYELATRIPPQDSPACRALALFPGVPPIAWKEP